MKHLERISHFLLLKVSLTDILKH